MSLPMKQAWPTAEEDIYDINLEDLGKHKETPALSQSECSAKPSVEEQPKNGAQVYSQPEHFPAIGDFNRTAISGASVSHGKKRTRRERTLPNLFSSNIVSRFKRVQVEPNERNNTKLERQNTYDSLQKLTTTMTYPAKGNMGVFVRYRDVYGYQEEEGDIQKIPILKKTRNKAMSAPACLFPSSSSLKSSSSSSSSSPSSDDDDDDVEFAYIPEAIEAAQIVRKKQIIDKLTGISGDYRVSQPKLKVVMNDGKNRNNPGITFNVKGNLENNTKNDKNEKNVSKHRWRELSRKVPGPYVFPKESHFVMKVENIIDTAEVGWMLKSIKDKKQMKEDIESYKKGNMIDKDHTQREKHSKLCRNSYPVTEALHKHGTSQTKRKAYALKAGEADIAKVWQRRSKEFTTPMQMASEDIHLKLSDEMKTCIANMKRVHQSNKKENAAKLREERQQGMITRQRLQRINRMMLL